MRRVDANPALRTPSQSHEGAGLGAVAMQHVRLEFSDQEHEACPDQKVRRMGLAVNRDAADAELEAGGDLLQRRLGAFAAGQAVGDDADMVTALCLSIGEIEDMPEDAADRRAHRVQDTKRLVWRLRRHRHDQNQRSPRVRMTTGATERMQPG